MAYNNYIPNFYSPYQLPTTQIPPQIPQVYQQPQNNQSGIVWVQGEAGAKSYLVGAGNSALLMDSEDSVFYIKSTDTSGMPMPLRIFDYTERTDTATANTTTSAPSVDLSAYVTKDELDKRLEQITLKTQSDNHNNRSMTRRNNNG